MVINGRSYRTQTTQNMKQIEVEIKKLVTMADIGLGVERPLNKEKRSWIKGLTKNKKQKPILIAPIKDSDRKSVVQGKSVDLGGRRIIKKTKEKDSTCDKSARGTGFTTSKGQ